MTKIKVLGALFVVLLTMTVGDAIWFPFVPLSDHTMARDISPSLDPIGRTYNFSPQDELAVSWIRFARDTRSHQMEWRWYAPNGRFYARTFDVVPPKDFTSGDWDGNVWSAIQIRGCDPSRMPGQWRVDVLRDWLKVQTEYFTIDSQVVTC